LVLLQLTQLLDLGGCYLDVAPYGEDVDGALVRAASNVLGDRVEGDAEDFRLISTSPDFLQSRACLCVEYPYQSTLYYPNVN
jgi:hypothetical protein